MRHADNRDKRDKSDYLIGLDIQGISGISAISAIAGRSGKVDRPEPLLVSCPDRAGHIFRATRLITLLT